MKIHELTPDLRIYEGHVIDCLRAMPDKSVQCVATSDPYYGLRSYGEITWVGGDPECDHAARDWDGPKQTGAARSGHAAKADRLDRETCGKCGARRVDSMAVDWPEVTYRPMAGLEPITVPAWYGPYGLEPTPEMYVGHSVLIRRELWRVMRDDGILWLNLGDSYNGSGGAGGDYADGGLKEGQPKYPGRRLDGLKPKDKLGIPHRVVFALQADGWYWRSDPPWIKKNPMPESTTDRPGNAHEFVFLLTKSERYYYDPDAVRVPAASTHGSGNGFARPQQISRGGRGSDKPWVPKSATFKREGSKRAEVIPGQTVGTHRPDREDTIPDPNGRYRRTNDWWSESLDVTIDAYSACIEHLKHVKEHGGLLLDEEGAPLGFMVNTKPFNAAHFAVWPENLARPMILAGTSPKACPHCQAPWERVVEKERGPDRPNRLQGRSGDSIDKAHGKDGRSGDRVTLTTTTTAWSPTCSCEENDGSGKCITLDIFHGSGTTGEVALELGRAYWGVELNPKYVEMSIRARLQNAQTTLLGRL